MKEPAPILQTKYIDASMPPGRNVYLEPQCLCIFSKICTYTRKSPLLYYIFYNMYMHVHASLQKHKTCSLTLRLFLIDKCFECDGCFALGVFLSRFGTKP